MDWPKFWEKWYNELIEKWNLDENFAQTVTVLLYYLSYFRIHWSITSGRRSQLQQDTLMAKWKAGDPSVKAKPATNSRHLTGQAVDISCNHPAGLGWLAKYLGLRWGGDFGKPDPVHVDAG